MTTSDFLKRISELPPKRLALLAAELQARLDAAEKEKSMPVAVVGIGCRFPGGANNPDSYWELLHNGVDAIREIPGSRWDINAYYDPDPDAPGKMNTRWGGFLNDVDQFDPQFFGISPREAASMDPQQRLLLEVAWEALENAGYAPGSLMGSSTGVFVGICNNDYASMMLQGQTDQIDLYLATGGASSVASGRVSYVLGLQGPSLSVDTACSSSLVAVHLAVQALRTGDCTMALAGGVNLILMPETTITLSKAKMMAADGRCKAFDASADGFVRSEGCGIVVLKRLEDALADGDRILAVIRGSAINQDGRSNGLTAPNGPSQSAVIRAALADARLEPLDVTYVETHGTGTSLGDPIEVQALGASLGAGRSHETPLLIGSVKTNLGHLESAAGIAGLIKLILMAHYGEIPPSLHLKEPNPYIPWDDLPVIVPTQGMSWTPENGRRIGGTSSFGFSGTNVHILVEQPPVLRRTQPERERPYHILTLSGKNEYALGQSVVNLERHLMQSQETIGDLSFTANAGRSHFSHRLAVVASDKEEFQAALTAYREGRSAERLQVGQEQRDRRIAFLFTGQGAQYAGMGQMLYETQPVFREAINKCDEILRSMLNRSLLSILYPADGADSPIHEIAYAQPAQFALQYALGVLWESWGIMPAAVLGHSVGEYAAACLAGVFSLEDALKLVTARGRLMKQTPAGEMASVFTNPEHVAQVIAPYDGRVSIAAVNGPETVVISGETDAVQSLIEALKTQKIRARRLEVDIAAHSPLMDSVLDAFTQVASTVVYSAPQVEYVSGLTGGFVEAEEIASVSYWRRHMREAVQFAPAMQALFKAGYPMYLEIGPAPTLISLGQRIPPEDAGVWLTSLRPQHDDWETMLKSLGTLYTRGVDVDWAGFDRDYSRRRLALPTYPFQRARHWVQQSPSRSHRAISPTADGHPLLGHRLKSPAIKDVVFESQLSATWPPYLDHHRIYGVVILPSPAYLEMALHAAQEAFGRGVYQVEGFTIHHALLLPEDDFRTVQFVLSPDSQGGGTFRVVSPDGDDWKIHASGSIRPGVSETITEVDIQAIQARCQDTINGADYYDQIRDLGLEFGSSFRGIRELWRCDGEALARVVLADDLLAQAGQYDIHPAFLDACFHLLGAPLPGEGAETAYLLIGIDSFQLFQKPGKTLWNHTVLTDVMNREVFTGDIHLFGEDGTLVAEVRGLQLKRAGREALMRATQQRAQDLFYRVDWVNKPSGRQIRDLPSLVEIADTAASSTSEGVANFPTQEFADLTAALDHLSIKSVVAAFHQLGWEMTPGETVTVDESVDRLGVVARHHRLLHRLLEMLVDEGILTGFEGGFSVAQAPAVEDITDDVRTLGQSFPDYAPLLKLFERCAPSLARVLRGEVDPLHLLFPGGSLADTEALYQQVPTALLYNGIVRNIVQAASANHSLRILEIGAGTGGTTASLLPVMSPQQTEYIFTDLSLLFLERAREKFGQYPFMRYELLDIAQNPDEQGFVGQQFDLIIAANVLHATADLSQTLAHVKRLLSPGGMLVLLEGTLQQRWVDLTFGFTEGWWSFADTDLRPDYPLLSQEQWKHLLTDMGFETVAILPDVPGNSILRGQAVILAGGASAAQQESAVGNWLILSDNRGIGEALANQLSSRGGNCLCVSRGEQWAVLDDSHREIAPDNTEHYQQLVSAADSWAGVIYLWGLDSPSGANQIDELATAHASSVLLLTQALIHGGTPTPLWLVSDRAQPVISEDVNVVGSPLWGMGRVLALEHPEVWGGVIDVHGDEEPAVIAQSLLAEVIAPDGEDQIGLRGMERFVARLVRTSAPLPQNVQFKSDGTYLITGGLGGLGLKLAQWIAERGAGHLILTSRRGLPDRAQWPNLIDNATFAHQIEAVQTIESRGTQVTIVAVDVGDTEGMEQVVNEYRTSLRGVFHLAAALEFWRFDEIPLDGLAAMLRSKASGAWVLHRATEGLPLDHFVLFSSTTALWGVAHMAHYAAANTFLDALAHYRRSSGLPALSVNWGTWEDMRIASTEQQEAVAQFGLFQIPTGQALEILGDLLGDSALVHVAVASVDWTVLKPAYETRRERPFLAVVNPAIKPANGRVEPPAQAQESELLERVTSATAEEQLEILVDYVRAEVASVLGGNPASTDIHQGLFEMGMDSLMSVDLKTRLQTAVGRSLPPTLTFNYPTVAELAEFLAGQFAAVEQLPIENAQPAQITPVPSDMDALSEDELEALLLRKLQGLQ